jgi:hypothetical protein
MIKIIKNNKDVAALSIPFLGIAQIFSWGNIVL